jgi:hypothetical protein
MEIANTFESNPMTDNCFNPSLFNFEIPNFENGKPVTKLTHIWILGSLKIDQHYVRFYLLEMESMFKIWDIIVRVEHFGIVSKMLSWSLNKENVWVKNNFKNIDFALNFD